MNPPFLLSEYPDAADDQALAATIGQAEGAVAVVRYEMTAGGDVFFGTCESEEKMGDYLQFHNADVVWKP